uniref:Uncharacterized protein n=1 Tax=Oryza punctata TaxID=4537 RepID=A0A0E0JGJ8_ORYPU
MSAERSGPRRRGGRQANNSRLRQGTVEGCSRTTRARGTRHDCEGVKVRRCRFPESSGELRGFKSGNEKKRNNAGDLPDDADELDLPDGAAIQTLWEAVRGRKRGSRTNLGNVRVTNE